jgi:hypothetical protein
MWFLFDLVQRRRCCMSTICVVNVKTRGKPRQIWEQYIGRGCYGLVGSVLANHFKIGRDGTREEVIEKYRVWLTDHLNKPGPSPIKEEMARLWTIHHNYGHRYPLTLFCWCAPERCHGDVIAAILLNMKCPTCGDEDHPHGGPDCPDCGRG